VPGSQDLFVQKRENAVDSKPVVRWDYNIKWPEPGGLTLLYLKLATLWRGSPDDLRMLSRESWPGVTIKT